jgi:hypothetical protein
MDRIYRVGTTTMRVPMTAEEIARVQPKEQPKPKRKRRVYNDAESITTFNGKTDGTGID